MGLQININSINISSQWVFFLSNLISLLYLMLMGDRPLVRAALEMTQFSKINNLEFH